MFKKIILIFSFFFCSKGHTKEEHLLEAMQSPHLYESVNVITGEYCENQVDLTTSNQLNIKRLHQSKDEAAMGWYFNPPILIEHDQANPPQGEIHLAFDSKKRLISMEKKGQSFTFNYSKDNYCLIENSQGKWAEYYFETPIQTRHSSPYLLNQVNYSDGRTCTYTYTNHPTERRKLISRRENGLGNYQIFEYYDSPSQNSQFARDFRLGSVKLQKAPVGTDETPIVTHQYFYHIGYTEVVDALGNKAIYRYGKNKKLTAIESFLNEKLYRVERFSWNDKDQMTLKSLEDENGNTIQSEHYLYDADGNIIENLLKGNLTGKGTDTYKTIYRYSKGKLTYHRSDNGVSVHYNYKGDLLSEKLTYEQDTLKIREYYEYDENGNLILGASNGRITRFTPHREHGLPETIDALGKKTVFTYSNDGKVIRKNDLEFAYDLGGRLIRSGDQEWTYDVEGRLIHYKDPSKEIHQTYDYVNRLIRKEVKEHGKSDSITSYEYDLNGNCIATIDLFGNRTSHIYDSLGREIYTQFCDGSVLQREYDLNDRIICVVDAHGNRTETEYNIRGKPTLIKYPDGSSESFEYYLDGSLKQVTAKDGSYTLYKRDYQSRPTEIITAHSSIKNTYDAFQLTSTTNALGLKTEYLYDEAGRLICTTDGHRKVEYQYDSKGNLESLKEWIDGSFALIVTERDEKNEITAMRIEDSTQTLLKKVLAKENEPLHIEYVYGDQLEKHITESNGNKIIIKYDGMGREIIIERKDPFGQIISAQEKQYDAVGNLLVDINGNITTYTYDCCNRVLTVSEDSQITSRTYNKAGQLEKLVKPDGVSLHYTYLTGGLLNELFSSDGTIRYRYSYDPAGNAIFVENLIDGTATKRTYDLWNQLVEETLNNGLTLKFTYDARGRKTGLTLPDGSKVDYIYDAAHLKAVRRLSNDNQERYTYKLSDMIVENLETECNKYDKMGQLIEEKNHSYTYDSTYNRLTKDGSPVAKPVYDACGNMVELNGLTLKYDAMNRLTHVANIRYTYDPFGRRIEKGDLKYLYDGEDEIGCVDSSGNLIEFRALNVATEIQGNIYKSVHDKRGSVVKLIDHVSNLTAFEASYSAFGEEELSGSIISPWRYAGKRVDNETGLVYFGKRFYDPATGRWITKDPLGTPDGPNRYAYALNNPVAYRDPNGLFSISDLIYSFWQTIQTISSYSLHTFDTFKHHLSFTEYIRPHFDKVAQDIVGRTPLHLAGFYQDASECGVHGKGELNDKVRVTLINGILNARIDYKNTIDYLSDCHGGVNVHYVFDATEGWTRDIFKAIAAKFGYVSPQAHMLAEVWKELIDEMGGVDGGGKIIHFAHSVGGTHTYSALSLMTPEELKMINIITFGSATLFDHSGVASVTNFVSKRDGVPFLDPVGYVKSLLGLNPNTIFVGSWLGAPLVDHTLNSSTYYLLIELIGQKFVEEYFLLS